MHPHLSSLNRVSVSIDIETTIFFTRIQERWITCYTVAPSFDTALLHDLVVRAGQKISYIIPIEASPKPKATWTLDGKVIEPDARHEMYTTQIETTFEIPFSVRSDSGRYAITLENEYGKFRWSIDIK